MMIITNSLIPKTAGAMTIVIITLITTIIEIKYAAAVERVHHFLADNLQNALSISYRALSCGVIMKSF